MNGVARDERIKAVIPRPNVYQYGDNFKRFVQRMKDYCILSEIKHNLHLLLLAFVDDKTYDLLSPVVINDGLSTNIEGIGEKYNEVICSRENVGVWRAKLLEIEQEENESIERFVQRLDTILLKAYPTGGSDEMKVTIFNKALKSKKAKLSMYQDEPRSYADAVRKAMHLEQAEVYMSHEENERIERKMTMVNTVDRMIVNSANIGVKHVQSKQVECSKGYQGKGVDSSIEQKRLKDQCIAQGAVAKSGAGNSVKKGIMECWVCKGLHIKKQCEVWLKRKCEENVKRRARLKSIIKGPPDDRDDGWTEVKRKERKKKVHFRSYPKNKKDIAVSKIGHEHLYAIGYIDGSKVRAFIDCGSNITLVTKDLIERLGKRAEVKPCNMRFRSFTKENIPVAGQIVLGIEMAGQTVYQQCVVYESMDSDILIGMDYLTEAKAIIDIPRTMLRTPNGFVRCISNPKSVEDIKKIKCFKTVTVPGNTVSYIKGIVPGKGNNSKGDKAGVFFGSQNLVIESEIFIANSMLYSEGNEINVEVLNPNEEQVTLFKGQVLGVLTPVEVGEAIHGVHRVEEWETKGRKHDAGSSINSGENANRFNNKRIDESRSCSEGLVKSKNVKVWTKEGLFEKLKVKDMNITEEQREELKGVLWEYRECFSVDSGDIGLCNMYEADIQLKTDYKTKWIPNRPVPHGMRKMMDDRITEFEKADIITKYDGNSPWNSPVMLVQKPNSEEFRLVQDGRYLNSQTVPDAYEMPHMQRVLDDLKDCKYLSTVDITSSFNQIKLTERSQPLTAFMYSNLQYIFKRMTMGSRNSSAKFCRCIDKLFGKVPFSSIVYYIDDVMIGSGSFETHIERLIFVLGKLKGAEMKLKPSKCHLFREEINFVGYTVSREGIKVDQSRVKAILELKAPTNVKGVQSIIGIFNFQRQFIKDFAGLTKPLYQLLRKENKFKWTKECEDSLNALKKALTEAPILAIPDTEDKAKSFRVETDSSGLAWGAVLSQVIDGDRRVIAYFSKSIPKYKRRLGASRLEFLALYHALKHWKVYLLNTSFTVLTDCKALTSLETLFQKSSNTQQRQMLELQNYNMTIKHISGKENCVADFLSRYNYTDQTVNVETQTECRMTQERGTQTDRRQERFDQRVKGVNSIGEEWEECWEKDIDSDSSDSSDYMSEEDQIERIPEQANSDHSVQRANSREGWANVCGEWYKNSKSQDSLQFSKEVKRNEKNSGSYLDTVWEEQEEGKLAKMVSGIVGEEEVPGEKETVEYDSNPPERKIQAVMMSEIREETKKDAILRMVLGWLEKGEKPKSIQNTMQPSTLVSLWKSFGLLSHKDGIVYRKWTALKPPFEDKLLIVVPNVLQERLLTYYHCGLLSVHAGVETCVNNCLKRFWWSKMRNEFKLFVKACIKCNHIKKPTAYLKAPLTPILNTDFNQCIYYLVAIPVRTQSAKETVGHLIKSWILKHGMPKSILSDRHKSFLSELFMGVMKAFGVSVKKSTSFKSSTNGRVERQNGRINQAMRAVMPEGVNDWTKYLPYVVSALNTFKNKHTGYSANFLVHGRELRFPQDFFIEDETHDERIEGVPVGTKAYRLYRLIKDVFYKARENAKVQARFMKIQYDKKVNLHVFKAGDYCFLLIDGDKGKFKPRWSGPFLIVKRISDHNYVVLIDPQNQEYKVVNIEKMKVFSPNKYSAVKVPLTELNSKAKRSDIITVGRSGNSEQNNRRERKQINDDDDMIYVGESVYRKTNDSRPARPRGGNDRGGSGIIKMEPIDIDDREGAPEEAPEEAPGEVEEEAEGDEGMEDYVSAHADEQQSEQEDEDDESAEEEEPRSSTSMSFPVINPRPALHGGGRTYPYIGKWGRTITSPPRRGRSRGPPQTFSDSG